MVKESEYGANTVYTCMLMEKMVSVENIPGEKENGGQGEFKYDLFDRL
jgi:hypothetical protein